ncbi:large ribosomal subunit protein uL10m isoform X2 [Paramormyrops kingsleyae]|uniref:large ribosomal subunit protein uL10m isoform X2 n=1 Tax=Paramormyrops kingsleyae TaxID=1676925 RepID=UPI000CD60E3E|nr:39S ribosomal protein L10, mitochondrial isoform X2 [Paramormyrops kingsleyae]
MAATLCFTFLPKQGWLPLRQCVRYGSKAVTRHRKPVHFLKQKLLAITEYIPPKPEECFRVSRTRETKQDSRMTAFIKREVQATFQQSKMIVVVQNNATTTEDMLQLRHRLHKHDVSVKFFPNQVMRDFLSDSMHKNMKPLFIGSTVLFVSKEPKLKEVLQILKSFPQLVLVGACVDDTLMSRQGIVSYSKLPPLATVQGQVLGGLSLLSSQTSSMLHRHPAHLSALLQQYLKQQVIDGPSQETGPEAQDSVA